MEGGDGFSAIGWHLRPEYAVNGGTADAAMGVFSPNEDTVPRALVEVKGPNVDLDRDRSLSQGAVRGAGAKARC